MMITLIYDLFNEIFKMGIWGVSDIVKTIGENEDKQWLNNQKLDYIFYKFQNKLLQGV